MHKHEPKVTMEFPWISCVAYRVAHDETAHGNIRRLEVCQCGVIKTAEVNAGVTISRGWQGSEQ